MPQLANAKHERFYVYAIRVDGRTLYIGKGTGKRMFTHLAESHNPTLRAKIEEARCVGRKVRARKIATNLTETQAMQLERRAIGKWRSRLVNVSMGSLSPLEHVATQARSSLAVLKSPAMVWAEGDYGGVAVADRVALLERIRNDLHNLAEAA